MDADRCPSCGEVVPEGEPCRMCLPHDDISTEIRKMREAREAELRRKFLQAADVEKEEMSRFPAADYMEDRYGKQI